MPVVTGLPVPQILAELAGAGITRLAADGAGTRLLPEVDLDPAPRLGDGERGRGLPQPLREACDEVVRVPIFGHAESLNLAMAATARLYASALAQHPAG